MLPERDSSVASSTGATEDDVHDRNTSGVMSHKHRLSNEKPSKVVTQHESPQSSILAPHESISGLSAKEVYFKARAHTRVHPVQRGSVAFNHYTSQQRKLFRQSGVIFEDSEDEDEEHESTVEGSKAELRKRSINSSSNDIPSSMAAYVKLVTEEAMLEARSRSHLLGRGIDRSEMLDTSGYKPPVRPSREEYLGATDYEPFSSHLYHTNQSRQLRLRTEKTPNSTGKAASECQQATSEISPSGAAVPSAEPTANRTRSEVIATSPTSAAEADGIARWRAFASGHATPGAAPTKKVAAKEVSSAAEPAQPPAVLKAGLIIKKTVAASQPAAPNAKSTSGKTSSVTATSMTKAKPSMQRKTPASASAPQRASPHVRPASRKADSKSPSDPKVESKGKPVNNKADPLVTTEPSTPDTRPKVMLIIKKRKTESTDESSGSADQSSRSGRTSQTGDVSSVGSVFERQPHKKAKTYLSATETPSPKAFSSMSGREFATKPKTAVTADKEAPLRRSARKLDSP